MSWLKTTLPVGAVIPPAAPSVVLLHLNVTNVQSRIHGGKQSHIWAGPDSYYIVL